MKSFRLILQVLESKIGSLVVTACSSSVHMHREKRRVSIVER